MKSNLLFGLCIFSLSINVCRADDIPPTTCPNVALNVGWNYIKNIHRDSWSVGQKNHRYDTNNNWTVRIAVTANSEKEAYEKANIKIVEANLLAGPHEEHDPKGTPYWKCLYIYSDGLGLASAITPPYL